MSKKIKWGVIGSGGIARRRTIPEGITQADNSELLAVFDINAEVNAEVAKEFGAKPCGSERELLENKDIDAVYIATPVNLHHDQVLAAAAAGKHVLCEKPLGLTMQETQSIIDACDKAGVKLGVGLMMRFHAYHQEALKMIREGQLGEPVFARAQLSCWYPPMRGAFRQDPSLGGGGSLVDMGGHCIDLLEMFFGDVVKVSCTINNIVHDYKSEDGAVATLFFENGALASVDAFFCVPDSSSKNVLELYGSKGSILASNTIGQGAEGDMRAYLEEGESGYNAQQVRQEDGCITIKPSPVNTYQAEIEEFSSAILEERPPAVGAETGLQSQKTLTACYLSAQTGRVVELKDI